MIELPPVLGRFERNPVVILVTGRTAVARVGGISAIRRHVATASRIGLTPVVLYPPRMGTLGAEIAAELEGQAVCLPADALDDHAGDDGTEALVIAADWFVSPAALYAFGRRTRGQAVARFTDRGRTVAPIARIPIGRLRQFVGKLSDAPVSEMINQAVATDATVVELDVGDRHRLSDNVAIERCERKLFGLGSHRAVPWSVRIFERYLAIPITRQLARTAVTPFQVSSLKLLVGFLCCYLVIQPGYWYGVLAASVYFVSRVLDAVAGDLARATVKPGSQGDEFDLSGDLAVHLLLIWSIAFRSGHLTVETTAAAIATAGLLMSSFLTYRRVLKPVWGMQTFGLRHRARIDNFATRFWRRNGPAYGFIVAALIGRLDLFLWGAAVASHLFYALWLGTDRKSSTL